MKRKIIDMGQFVGLATDYYFRPNPLWLGQRPKMPSPCDSQHSPLTEARLIEIYREMRDSDITRILEWPEEDRQRLYEHLNAKGHRMK